MLAANKMIVEQRWISPRARRFSISGLSTIGGDMDGAKWISRIVKRDPDPGLWRGVSSGSGPPCRSRQAAWRRRAGAPAARSRQSTPWRRRQRRENLCDASVVPLHRHLEAGAASGHALSRLRPRARRAEVVGALQVRGPGWSLRGEGLICLASRIGVPRAHQCSELPVTRPRAARRGRGRYWVWTLRRSLSLRHSPQL